MTSSGYSKYEGSDGGQYDETEQLRRELEQLKLKNAELEKLAYVDGLTGLFNRRSYDEALRRELDLAQRRKEKVALLIFDIDLFKNYNDTYGHAAGDTVLREFAKILDEASRSTDIVCRYGGEEFAVIAPDINGGAEALAERMRAAVEAESKTNPAFPAPVTCSVGVTVVKPDKAVKSHPEKVFEEADEALYEAKKAGRNKVKKA